MCQDDTVQYLPAFDVSHLLWGNDIQQDWFESTGDDLGEELVDDVAESDGPVLLWFVRFPLFRNEGKESSIKGSQDFSGCPRVL